MIKQLKDLDDSIVRAIIKLEAETMIPILQKIGIQVSPEEMANEILKEPQQNVIAIVDGSKLEGVLRYSQQSDHLFIKSLQIANQASPLLAVRKLLRECSVAFERETLNRIESVVQRSNLKSQSLHHKLGFTEARSTEKAIRFSIDRNKLILRLRSLCNPIRRPEQIDDLP